MKRVFALLIVLLLAGGRSAKAQDAPAPAPAPAATTAAAVAAKQAADERYERMAADIQALQADNQSLKAKIASLEQKIEDLRRQQAEAASHSGAEEALKGLAAKIEEVDRKRQEDKLAISEEIRKAIAGLEKTLAGPGATSRAPAPRTPTEAETAAAANGYSYKIQEGDTLSAIVKAYNADFKSKGLKPISLKQVQEANPTVDSTRLRVGQKIIIPRPEPQ